MFLPTTPEEIKQLGWDGLDVILVTGDTYIDSPHVGAAMIGRVLLDAGYRVGLIAQPRVDDGEDISRLGAPRLFWGVTSGCVDSMVANYTALGKRIKSDDFTPGGVNNRRPDRAVIAYTNLIRRHFKETAPIVLGGLEASLRRISHYDFKTDAVRRSILFDAKADLLVFGMGEKPVLALAQALKKGAEHRDIPGLCYVANKARPGYIELPSHEQVRNNNNLFTEMFQTFHQNQDPLSAQGLCQKQDTRFLVCNPPSPAPETRELDHYHELDYQREVHPFYGKDGAVRALDTIRFSIITHRGCFGECSFCAITAHQGRDVISRSEESILREAASLTRLSGFKGVISDVGGPTANMYGMECSMKQERVQAGCPNKRCLTPQACKNRRISHQRQVDLLARISRLPGVKKAFVSSGIRYDLILQDKRHGKAYLRQVMERHTSGQMKVAPEHCAEDVLRLMGKPGAESLRRFKDLFEAVKQDLGANIFLTYYFMAAHPGCTLRHMEELNRFIRAHLHIRPRQVQIFTPTPSTLSTLMYHTGKNPVTGESLHVEKNTAAKQAQKDRLQARPGG